MEAPYWVFEMQTVESREHFTGTTDGKGALWLPVGTDSDFEGRTELYYMGYRATLRELQEACTGPTRRRSLPPPGPTPHGPGECSCGPWSGSALPPDAGTQRPRSAPGLPPGFPGVRGPAP